jgi:hypothetical protein
MLGAELEPGVPVFWAVQDCRRLPSGNAIGSFNTCLW